MFEFPENHQRSSEFAEKSEPTEIVKMGFYLNLAFSFPLLFGLRETSGKIHQTQPRQILLLLLLLFLSY